LGKIGENIALLFAAINIPDCIQIFDEIICLFSTGYTEEWVEGGLYF